MNTTRRNFIIGGGAILASPAIMRSASAQAATTLRLHHFLPAVSNVHAKLLAPWAKKVEDASGGKLKIDIYPSMQLGGTPPQLYDQARDGVADIIWTLPGTTPGRFPSTEVFELPFVASRRGIVNAQASQEYADTFLKDETKETKILSFWSHDRGLIHATKQVKTMEDLQGLKLRFPTRLAGEALKALGANAIGMPIPQVPESLAQKVIDGAVVPWEVVPAIKLHELVKFHTDIPGSPTLYTASFFLAMNKAKYDGLAPDLKAVMDKLSGQAFAIEAGKVWDNAGAEVEAMVKAKGNTVTVITEEEKARWVKTTAPVIETWLKAMKDKNLDGAKQLEAAKALLAKYEKA